MSAFNFTVFIDKVKSGAKTTTIRALRKDGRLPKRHELLHLFTGMRTKKCRKLMIVPCEEIRLITITETRIKLGSKWCDLVQQEYIRSLDGFESLTEMRDWFARTHGLPFKGYWTRWNPNLANRWIVEI